MLRRAGRFATLTVTAWDGPIGQIDDFYFDDLEWTVRYLVVRTGEWLDGRRVLLVPDAVKTVRWEEQELRLDLNREQVASSPPMASEEPISRQYEELLHQHYGWPFYWTNINPLGLSGPGTVPPVPPAPLPETAASEVEEENNPHLRSLAEVTDYEVRASDGSAGTIDDFIVNTESWTIFYMLIDTSNWLQPEKKVLLAPTWVEEIDWTTNRLTVDLPQDLIENSPEYDPAQLIEREYEEQLYEHYGRPGYWTDMPEDIS